MSQFIDIVFACPPSLDCPTLVGVQDEYGQPVQSGAWLAPSAEAPYWRLRFTPAQLLQHIMLQMEELTGGVQGQTLSPAPLAPMGTGAQLQAQAGRSALKGKLAGKVQKGAPQAQAQTEPAEPGAALVVCPACSKPFDPHLHQLVECSECGEAKCTANCFELTTEPCIACRDRRGRAGEANAVMSADEALANEALARRVFDGEFHAKPGAEQAAEEED